MEKRSLGPVFWWAVTGLLFLALQSYVYTRWLSSGPVAVATGADPVPTIVKVWAWVLQPLAPIALVLSFGYVIRRSRREGRICFDALLLSGWILVYWQDPMPVMLSSGFFYNSYLVNLGSWAPHIPGWLSPNADLMPAPLLLTSGLFPVLGMVTAITICAVMRWARSRAALSDTALVAVAIGAGIIADLVLETLLLQTGLDSYAGSVRALTLWGGLPAYEAVLLGSVWGVVGAVRYFLDPEGLSAAERGLGRLRVSARSTAGVRILAVSGLLNVLFLSYALLFNVISLHGGPVPDGFPSYLRNGVCGPGTSAPCPSPHAPIPVR